MNPNAYLQAFTDFKMAEARLYAAQRGNRESRAADAAAKSEYAAAYQQYRECGARMVLIADKLGIKPLGDFQARIPVGVG